MMLPLLGRFRKNIKNTKKVIKFGQNTINWSLRVVKNAKKWVDKNAFLSRETFVIRVFHR